MHDSPEPTTATSAGPLNQPRPPQSAPTLLGVAPSVIWTILTSVFLSWVGGIILAAVHGSLAKKRGHSQKKYWIAALVTPAGGLVLLFGMLAILGNMTPLPSSAGQGLAASGQSQSSPSAGAASGTSSATSGGTVLDSVQNGLDLLASRGVTLAPASVNDNGTAILDRLNRIVQHARAYRDSTILGAAVINPSGSFYQNEVGFNPTALYDEYVLTGLTGSEPDPQAHVQSDARWYDLSVRHQDGSTTEYGALMFRFEQGTWVVVDGAPPTTGLTFRDDPQTVVNRLEALHEEAFLQHSAPLLKKYWNPNADDNSAAPIASDQQMLAQGGDPGLRQVAPGSLINMHGLIYATVSDANGSRKMRYIYFKSGGSDPSALNQWYAEGSDR